MSACEPCLRRTALLGSMGPWLQWARDGRRRLPEVLALPDEELVRRVGGAGRARLERVRRSADADAVRRRAAAGGMRVVCRHSRDYPRLLMEANDAPVVLHLMGDTTLLGRCAADGAVAIVGSRKASPYGLGMAHALGRDLAAAGVPVVSGMAYGIDSAAHTGALSAGGPTIAVMPGGADVAYPSSKRGLHERIKARGLVLAEMPPGMRPFRWSFPARNRIMAALARMTVVVEGAEGSGSLITAAFAQDLGREVGAVPGDVTRSVAVGPNRLLAEGAVVVRSAEDVLDVLYGPGNRPSPPPVAAAQAGLEPRLQGLLKQIENGIGTVEGLADSADVADVLAGLSELELLGLVTRGPGGDYVRRA